MPSNGLIAFARIKPGREDRLREMLNPIGNDINAKRMIAPRPHFDFPSSRTIHFARLAICDDPEAGPGRKRLLLATDFDGDLAAHVHDLWHITHDPDAIWSCCEGYDGQAAFIRFLNERRVEPQVHYIAFPGQTVDEVRSDMALNHRLEAWLHTPEARALTSAAGKLEGGSLWSRLAGAADGLTSLAGQSINSAGRAAFAGLDVLGIMRKQGPINTVDAARRVNATIDHVWWIQLFNLLTLNVPPQPRHRYSDAPVDTAADCAPAEPGDEVCSKQAWNGTPGEDLVSQNQLTLITVVEPEGLSRLQAVLAVIDLFARRLTTPGELVGISTIHTVRWALIDGGKRFLMLSNYDGTWESYIDEFAELILSGLNALWDTSYGFPTSGAHDVAALKHFLRCHQVPANVFYSAYPTATVLNIADNHTRAAQLRRQLAGLNENGSVA